MSTLNDWQNEQNETGAKHKFGNLSLIVNRVKSQAGAKYTLPGIVTKDTNGNVVPREFRGKVLDPQSERLHVILVLEATDKNGQSYQDVRDDLSFSNTIKIAKASLVDVFGPTFAEVFAQRGKVPVEVELVPTGDKTNTDKDKTTFKVLRQFATDAERVAAEREYFKRFGSVNGHSHVPAIPADVVTLGKGLYDAVSKNREQFLTFAAQQPNLAPYAAQLADLFAAS